jgi:HK97 family phage prohead protease
MDFRRSIILSKSEIETDEAGTIEGYASVYYGTDSYGDTIVKGAFDDCVQSEEKPKMFFNHDRYSVPIGKWEEVTADDKGLYVKGRLNLEVFQAKDVYSAVKAGDIDGFSVCMMIDPAHYTLKDASDQWGGGFIEHVEALPEISVVTFPADKAARIEKVKSVDFSKFANLSDFEHLLRDAGFSKSAATGIVSRFKAVAVAQGDPDAAAKAGTTNDELSAILARIRAI